MSEEERQAYLAEKERKAAEEQAIKDLEARKAKTLAAPGQVKQPPALDFEDIKM